MRRDVNGGRRAPDELAEYRAPVGVQHGAVLATSAADGSRARRAQQTGNRGGAELLDHGADSVRRLPFAID